MILVDTSVFIDYSRNPTDPKLGAVRSRTAPVM